MNSRSRTSDRFLRILTAGLLAVLFLLPAPAVKAESLGTPTVDPLDPDNSYSAILYNNTNGLPTSEANDIAETSDGFIWIGSYSGLIRYDGNTFERMNSTSGITSVISLLVDSEDRLWIGTNDHGLGILEKGSFRRWGLEDGLTSVKINDITEDDNGIIYLATPNGIMTATPDGTFTPLTDGPIDGIYAETLVKGADGLIYGISNTDDFFVLLNGRLYSYISHTESKISGVLYICPDRNSPGYIYIGTDSSSLYYAHISSNFIITREWDISPLNNIADIKQFGDHIWITARNGIGVMTQDGFTTLNDLPINNSVGHMMKDYEGNIWFTSSRQGVMKLVPNRFVSVFEKYHVNSTVVNSTCMSDEGLLFIATDTGLIVLDDQQQLSELPLSSAHTASGKKLSTGDLIDLLRGYRIRSVIRDRENRIWISTWRGVGLVCYDHGSIVTYTEEDGLISNHIRAICEKDDGDIVVALTGGASVIRDGKVTASYQKSYGIANEETLTVTSAPNGDILIGSNGGGIYIVNEMGLKHIDVDDGLSSGIIMRIKYDERNQVFWIVTSNSLAFMTMDYQVKTITNFPYSNNFDLYQNAQGDMWILSSNGIYVISSEALMENAEDLSPVHYSLANGLPTISTSNSYSELTDEGILYLAGNSDVARVNINEPLENISDIKISIPYVEADGVRLYPDKNGMITLSSEVKKLTVYSYVYNYLLTDPLVSYQLKNFDAEPVRMLRSQLDPVSYTNLPGGTYEFELQLMDSLGLNSRSVSVTIVKKKALHEHALFYVVSLILTGIIFSKIVHAIMSRQRRILENKHREQVYKERLVTELQTANRIQSSMLPHIFPPFPERSEFDIFAMMDPAREVGGDFYDFFLVDDDHLCMIIADVSGKGIPAALFMMASNIILKNFAMMKQSPGEILDHANEALCSNNQEEMFVTVWLGILEISSGVITAANAGHEYPIIDQNGRYTLYRDRHSLVLGGLKDIKFPEYQIKMKPGDRLFVYTDGLPEATDGSNQMFGNERMLEALNQNYGDSPEQLLPHVSEAVEQFVQDAEQFDDLTMLCFRYNGTSGK